jgi:hypothetical protein
MGIVNHLIFSLFCHFTEKEKTTLMALLYYKDKFCGVSEHCEIAIHPQEWKRTAAMAIYVSITYAAINIYRA